MPIEFLGITRHINTAEIVLESGIRIDRQTWLNGFPPRIRLHGDRSRPIRSGAADPRIAQLSRRVLG